MAVPGNGRDPAGNGPGRPGKGGSATTAKGPGTKPPSGKPK